MFFQILARMSGRHKKTPETDEPVMSGDPESQDTAVEAADDDQPALLGESMRFARLYVYRLRILCHLAARFPVDMLWDRMMGEYERFMGLSVEATTYFGQDRDIPKSLHRLRKMHEANLEKLLAQCDAGADSHAVLLDALGMNEPVYRDLIEYMEIAMNDTDLCYFLDRVFASPSFSDHRDMAAAGTAREVREIAPILRNMEEAGLIRCRGGEFHGGVFGDGLRLHRYVKELLSEDIGSREQLIQRITPKMAQDHAVTLDLFPHLAPRLEQVQRLLRHAASQGEARHVLLVGPAGTGKSSCALALARALNLQPVQVSIEDADGDNLPRQGRLTDYRLKQALFQENARDTLLLFDEVDNIFGNALSGLFLLFGRTASEGTIKARLNHLMDSARVSTIWISNSTEDWDPAYLRRFHLIVHVTVPPRELRLQQVAEHCADLSLPEAFIEQLTERHLPVALLTQTAGLVAGEGLVGEAAEREMRSILDGYLAATGKPRLQASATAIMPPFDLRHLNLGMPAQELFAAVEEHATLRLLFSGPPGAGKTELARQIARKARKDLIELRASDLLSKYVGETEKQIAAEFARAAAQDAVLLIDEADSFLRARSTAQQGWETTQVNELLVQIEAFPGLLILGTNRRAVLDEALIRRMDFKLRFRPLDCRQRIELFRAVLAHHGADDSVLDADIRAALDAMPQLVIGDFRPPLRRLQVSGRAISAESLIRELRDEYAARYPERRIGFVGAA